MHCITILTSLTFAQDFPNASRRLWSDKKKGSFSVCGTRGANHFNKVCLIATRLNLHTATVLHECACIL